MVRLCNGAVSTDQEHIEWFKDVVYARQGQVCDVLQRVVKRSLCRLVWEVRWMKSNKRMVSNVETPNARVEQRRMQLHEGWKRKLVNAGHLEPWHVSNQRFSTRVKTTDSGLWRRAPCMTSRRHDQRTSEEGHSKEDGS